MPASARQRPAQIAPPKNPEPQDKPQQIKTFLSAIIHYTVALQPRHINFYFCLVLQISQQI